jgi:hypothetical protein
MIWVIIDAKSVKLIHDILWLSHIIFIFGKKRPF